MELVETNFPQTPSDLEAFWMPFTANQQFKAQPRLLVAAKGMYYTTDDGRQIVDGTAGLWCVNAGHSRQEIAKAVQDQVTRLDFAPTFQMGHPGAFELATRLVELLPGELNRVFFTNSTNRDSAKIHTMIATFSANQTLTRSFTFEPMIGDRNFQSCVY